LGPSIYSDLRPAQTNLRSKIVSLNLEIIEGLTAFWPAVLTQMNHLGVASDHRSQVNRHPHGPGPVTSETVGAKDLRYYLLGAGFIVMIVWLLIVLFG
jgi:hypothetical protein